MDVNLSLSVALGLFGAAIGWLSAVATYAAKVQKYESRITILESQSPKIDAIYRALIRQGFIGED